MNKSRFNVLVFLMSISLVGIVFVQVYWIRSLFDQSETQFRYQVHQIIDQVSSFIDNKEYLSFYKQYNKIKDSIGREPESSVLREILVVEKDRETQKTTVYSNKLMYQDFGIDVSFFSGSSDSLAFKELVAHRKVKVSGLSDQKNVEDLPHSIPDYNTKIEEFTGSLGLLEKANFEVVFRDIVSQRPLESRITKKELEGLLDNTMKRFGINTDYQYAVISQGDLTSVSSKGFNRSDRDNYSIPIFKDNQGESKYQLLLNFPGKRNYLFSSILSMSVMTLIMLLIILYAYVSAIRLLLKQKRVSEVKTDFINNMTHEFKTPIATINLALDAIKNPKILVDQSKVERYLKMIREENHRMHRQVENVLRISRLEKKELQISKQVYDLEQVLDAAIEHVALIVENKSGKIIKNYRASKKNVLLNKLHFTNILVNILDNAIKYNEKIPCINISTTNTIDLQFLEIKINDNGIGMSKSVQKRVFEKFYREPTGDIHNVKGHGLGLAYVRKIVEDHQGEVFVESEKGVGSTFTIKIPLIN